MHVRMYTSKYVSYFLCITCSFLHADVFLPASIDSLTRMLKLYFNGDGNEPPYDSDCARDASYLTIFNHF